ncbi:hypothetical protein TRFO_11942 [Tritrichomonas foetus]|uniref:Uncharacterized protein n=1 Tax=Tritrichomonas foetus TaxID=1144522 RepID=A0A1J4J188_9EUKA|nr:hypothetical protein TRFO_11942 [Tritrichomonas foetus]|eukprot:OHS93312.1 hypothetical protein TRFO_11942 [Tritrichomonas foetus]
MYQNLTLCFLNGNMLKDSVAFVLPHLSTLPRISIEKSFFQNFFGPFFSSSNPMVKLILFSTQFSFFLSSAIRITSEEADTMFQNHTFIYRQNVNHGGSVLIDKCVFNKCKTPAKFAPFNNGGAVYIISSYPSTDLTVTESGFRDCVAVVSGGAIFFCGGFAKLNYTVFKSSSAVNGGAHYLDSAMNLDINVNYTGFIGYFNATYGCSFTKKGFVSYFAANITKNNCVTGQGTFIYSDIPSSFSLKYCHVCRLITNNAITINKFNKDCFIDNIIFDRISDNLSNRQVKISLLFINSNNCHAYMKNIMYIKVQLLYIDAMSTTVHLMNCYSDIIVSYFMFKGIPDIVEAFSIINYDNEDAIKLPVVDLRICFAAGKDKIPVTNTFTATQSFLPTNTMQMEMFERYGKSWNEYKRTLKASKLLIIAPILESMILSL